MIAVIVGIKQREHLPIWGKRVQLVGNRVALLTES